MAPELNIPDVANEVFAFSAVTHERQLRVRLTGAADARANSELETFVRSVHEEVGRLGVREVVVDMTGLSFMSSSCLKAFVGWLSAIQELEPGQRYRVRFAWDEKSYWQRRSLQALKSFANEVVQV
jgi:anti-anti-sigma factor